jgi:hypothetical protein
MRNYNTQTKIPFSVWVYGFGFFLSCSQLRIIVSHSSRRSAGNVASNFLFSDVCFAFMTRALIRDRRSKSPEKASAVKFDAAENKGNTHS